MVSSAACGSRQFGFNKTIGGAENPQQMLGLLHGPIDHRGAQLGVVGVFVSEEVAGLA